MSDNEFVAEMRCSVHVEYVEEMAAINKSSLNIALRYVINNLKFVQTQICLVEQDMNIVI